MSDRVNFSRKVRHEVFIRAKGRCEECGAYLKVGEFECDHVVPDELGGLAVAANAQCLCRLCHKVKTASDIRRIRKADRQRDRHNGTMKPTSRPIPGSKASGIRKRMNGDVERWA